MLTTQQQRLAIGSLHGSPWQCSDDTLDAITATGTKSSGVSPARQALWWVGALGQILNLAETGITPTGGGGGWHGGGVCGKDGTGLDCAWKAAGSVQWAPLLYPDPFPTAYHVTQDFLDLHWLNSW